MREYIPGAKNRAHEALIECGTRPQTAAYDRCPPPTTPSAASVEVANATATDASATAMLYAARGPRAGTKAARVRTPAWGASRPWCARCQREPTWLCAAPAGSAARPVCACKKYATGPNAICAAHGNGTTSHEWRRGRRRPAGAGHRGGFDLGIRATIHGHDHPAASRHSAPGRAADQYVGQRLSRT